MTISIGSLLAIAAFSFTYQEDIPDAFHEITGHALEERVELIASNLEQTQQNLSEVIIESNLQRLRDELRRLNESILHHGDDGYNIKRKVEVEAEIRYWEAKRNCVRDPKLC